MTASVDNTSADRVRRLEAGLSEFRSAQPEMVRALDALGVRIEDYESGLGDQFSTFTQAGTSELTPSDGVLVESPD